MPELHCIVTGRVQGVAYRAFVQNIARDMNLKGFVANLPDGSVEVVAQGDLGVLKVLVNHLRTGPDSSKVSQVLTEWTEGGETYEGFEIRL